MSQLASALKSANIKILKFDPSKQRPVTTDKRGTINIEKFSKILMSELGKAAIKYPDVFEASHSIAAMEKLIEAHTKENKTYVGQVEIEIPKQFEDLTLNMDVTSRDTSFFMTTKNEMVSDISGNTYIKAYQMNEAEAVSKARMVWPTYLPREDRGVSKKIVDGIEKEIFNIYVPPSWMDLEEEVPDKLPELFQKLVKHLFPIDIEREYFYSWLHYSLFDRAFVYLILCGAPGTGKNRLKLVMRALHGHINTIDGKRSTLVERFNSQLADATLAWFDELHYDMDMENNMKELQNDSISIEKKGIDATRSTRIYASLAISNNKPRDNFISFDSRKFAPMNLTTDRLEKSMTSKDIKLLSEKVENPEATTFDVKFIAQIARWIQKHGKSDKWPHLEYRGPMFYKLAHTSMSRWQKKAASIILSANPRDTARARFDKDKGYLWSSLQELSQKKHGDKSLQFPDFTSIKYFFDIFMDDQGRKAFKTLNVKGDIMGDFWVKSLFEVKIFTEAQVLEGGKSNGKENSEAHDEETYDL